MELSRIIEGTIAIVIGGFILALIVNNTHNLTDFSALGQFSFIDKWLLGGVIASILIMILFKKRRRRWYSRSTTSFNDYRWYIPCDTIDYADVKWIIGKPDQGQVYTAQLKVKPPSRCPQCGTELEQSQIRFGRYLWKCVKCNFKKKNKLSYWDELTRVERIARRKWEQGGIQ